MTFWSAIYRTFVLLFEGLKSPEVPIVSQIWPKLNEMLILNMFQVRLQLGKLSTQLYALILLLEDL